MSLCLYRITYLIFWGVSWALMPFSKKLRLGMKSRRGLLERLQTAKEAWTAKGLNPSPYWFHFASAGELEQAIPIAEELKKREPQASILFTFFSPSGEKAVNLETSRRQKGLRPLPWDAADYVPLDLPWKVGKALEMTSPKSIILINRELWPELLVQAHRRNIPLFLFSAFFPSHKTKMLNLWAPYLKILKCIGTVGDSTTQLVLETLQKSYSSSDLSTAEPDFQTKITAKHELNSPVFSIGDTRVERVLERRALQLTSPAWSDFLNQRPLLVGASLWKEDFEALKPSLEQIRIQHSGWRFCLVPHEPHETFISLIKNWGREKGISFRRFSHFLENPDDFSPLIMDRVGLLAELYRFSSLAFVGGSFKSRVHNVLEPAAYKNAIVTGPFIQNSFEATEMARLKSGLVSVNSSQNALEAILNRMSDVSLLKSEGEKAYSYLMERQGASKKYCDLLLA